MGRSRAAAVIAIALCASLFVAACSGDDDDTTTKVEARGPLTTMTPGVLTVGTELPAPTFWDSADYDSVRHGYEADIVHELARRLGKLKVKVVEYPFVGINAGAPCDCDITFSQIGITKERRGNWDFTVPYLDADYGVMVKTSSNVTDVATARTLRFGVQAETTALDFLQQQLRPNQVPVQFDRTTEMFDAFNTGAVDAIIFDLPILLSAMTQGQVADAKIVGQFSNGDSYGAALPKDSPNTSIIDRTMEAMKRDGTMDSLQKRYFGITTRNAAPFWTL
jgi:polar amino acid transport system substrate-binding protein